MEHPPFLNPIPTPYQQGRFCFEAYQGPLRNDGLYAAYGYTPRDLRPVDHEFPVHMYLPVSFPAAPNVPFDWSRWPGELTVGFSLRGTDLAVRANIGACWEVLRDQLMSYNTEHQTVSTLSSKVLRALEGLLGDYPQIEENKIRLRVFLAGHSLGGFLATALTVLLQDWAARRSAQIHCTTFDSPGVVPQYRNMAMQQNEDAAYWEERITNYLSLPNPINMCHKHLGKMVHLNVCHDVRGTSTWVGQCVAGTAMRLTFYTCVSGLVGRLFGTAVNMDGVRALAMQTNGEISANAVAKQLEKLLPNIFGSSLVAFVGLSMTEILEQHAMRHMLNCFHSDGDGQPREGLAIEMERWPTHDSFTRTIWKWVKGVGKEFVPFHPGNAGLHTLRNKQKVIQHRLRQMEDYVPRELVTGEEARNRHLMSD